MKNIIIEVSKEPKINKKLKSFEFQSPILTPSSKKKINKDLEAPNKVGFQNRLFKRNRLYSKINSSKSRFLRRTRYGVKKSTLTNSDDLILNDS